MLDVCIIPCMCYADVPDGHMEPTENLPVATLVSEGTSYHSMPQSTAPLNPHGDKKAVAGDGCCTAAASNKSSYPQTRNYTQDPTISRVPMMMTECPHCLQESRTRVKVTPSWKTWAAGGCLVFVFWPLCWLPLVVDSCKTTEHFCVKCGAQVAKMDAFEDCCVEHRE